MSFDGQEVDLDDPNLYDYLPNDPKSLDDLMFKEIGYALCYMNNFHPEIFKSHKQKTRVLKMIKNFCDERVNHYEDVSWYQEQVFLFQDEIDNMC